MIKQTKDIQVLKNLHGGTGSVEIQKKLTKEDAVEGLDMFAEVILKANASIGYHLHTDDAEAYYIVEGEGIFLDENEQRVSVEAGDLCLIKKGQSHGLENPTEEELKMIAVVY